MPGQAGAGVLKPGSKAALAAAHSKPVPGVDVESGLEVAAAAAGTRMYGVRSPPVVKCLVHELETDFPEFKL